MLLTLTARAQHALRDVMHRQGLPLRLAINPGGCSGFDIVFNASATQPDDRLFGPTEAPLVIDPVSLSLIEGATVDFVDEIGREGFIVTNITNLDARCGCGKSFSLADTPSG